MTVATEISRVTWGVPILLLALSAPLWLHTYEPAMFVYLNTRFAALPSVVWAGLSLLGNAWGVLGVTAPLLVLAPRLLWAWLCAAPFAILFTRLGKGMIVSPRPAAVVNNTQIHILGERLELVSMPSGHTLTAFAVASGIYFALPVATRWRHGWLFVLAAAVGLSRIAVGAHWPGDVAVGVSLGLLSGMLGNVLLARMAPTHWQPAAWSLRAVALLVLAATYPLWDAGLDFAEALPVQKVLALVAVGSVAVFAWNSGANPHKLRH